jgi:hypothetical protein
MQPVFSVLSGRKLFDHRKDYYIARMVESGDDNGF